MFFILPNDSECLFSQKYSKKGGEKILNIVNININMMRLLSYWRILDLDSAGLMLDKRLTKSSLTFIV